MMSLQEYSKRLVKVWCAGFFGLILIFGGGKWVGYRFEGEARPQSVLGDIAFTLGVAILLPSLIVVRAHFRYKKWLAEEKAEAEQATENKSES